MLIENLKNIPESYSSDMFNVSDCVEYSIGVSFGITFRPFAHNGP